jgi:AGZA family xanthine/uracil permease-like MFS transporter
MSTTTGTAGKIDFKPALWTPGDWNAFFGFGTNILVNMLVLTGLLRFVLKMPDSLVFGRILPALGLMMCLSTFYYAYLAYRLAQKTGRTDVCALPSGISVPHMFIVTFVIMLPITIKTGDPVKGWSAGLVWVFFQSFMLMIGGFIGPVIQRITPRAALLGTLAGVAITFISMRPALEMFMTPQIGLVCFAIILVSWFGGVKYPKSIPAGLVAIAVGMIIAWGSNLFGLNLGGLSVKGLGDAFANFGFSLPIPALGQIFSGFEYLGIILVTAIPFGIYDLVEALDNVESAEAAGDHYPTTRVLTADGVVSLIGCLMGNPFINAVYIGHPGWKAMGGRIGYSAATGIMIVVLSWFGIISVMLALVPVVAISPILLYIGMLIGAQAFQATPIKHAPAIVLALTPHLAAWGKLQIDTMLGSTINAAQAVGGLAADKIDAVKTAAIAALPQQGVLYHGLEVMGGGSILAGLVLGAIGVFVIEREFNKASAFALAGAILTYFGFMHGESVGIGGGLGVTPGVALAYAAVAVGFLAAEKFGASPETMSSEAMSSLPEIRLAAPAE